MTMDPSNGSGGRKKIGLLDHMGGGNLGDDATQTAVMRNIKKRWPESAIFGFSMNPSDTQTRHGIPSYPIRRQTWDWSPRTGNSTTTFKKKVKAAVSKYRFLFLLLKAIKNVAIRIPRPLFQEVSFLVKSFRIIRSFDLLIISGGGQLLDSWGGPWKFPYTVLKWVLLAKLSKVSCYFLNVGAGPLRHPLSRFFVKYALFLGDYASFRDEKSRTLVQEIGFRGRSHVVADCVYGLDIPRLNPACIGRRTDPLVGISPMAYYDPRIYWEKDQGVYECFIRTLALFGSWLSRNHHRLRLFTTDIWFDTQTIEELRTALMNDPQITDLHSIMQEPIKATEDLFSQMSSMDYVVTCRFHGVVFAHLMNIPVLALSHHPKVATLMNDLGLSEYCLDIRTLDLGLLINTFIRLADQKDHVKARMAEKAELYKGMLRMQFDTLFPQELS
jgi:polysaccharide pyruvyl transferase WcaK-like protein